MTANVLVPDRLLADIYTDPLRRPLSEAGTCARFVGGFAGNVGTELHRPTLAFCEDWIPDHLPNASHRTSSCPDWELAFDDFPLAETRAVPWCLAAGTGLEEDAPGLPIDEACGRGNAAIVPPQP